MVNQDIHKSIISKNSIILDIQYVIEFSIKMNCRLLGLNNSNFKSKQKLTSSRRFTHRPHGLSSIISLSSSESSPLSFGDFAGLKSLILLWLPNMSKLTDQYIEYALLLMLAVGDKFVCLWPNIAYEHYTIITE